MTEVDVAMPRLSETMEAGTIARWLVDQGSTVEPGDELVEIEHDKASVVHHAPVAGILTIVVPAGESARVGTTIARLGSDPGPTDPRPENSQIEVARAPEHDRTTLRPTPLANRAAAVHRVDLAAMRGSGPRGRILQRDVLEAVGLRPERPRRPSPAAAGPPERVVSAPPGLRRWTSTEQLIAERMSRSASEVPSFQVQADASVDALVAFRHALADLAQPLPTLNDLIIKACAAALRAHPEVNSTYHPQGLDLHDSIHIGFAVAVDRNLLVPTVHDADSIGIGRLAAMTRRLVERCRAGQITPAEMTGATFTVSNLGMYGMTSMVPVINPPQVAILGVGAVRTEPMISNGQLSERRVMTLTMSADHRVLYGADAASFLGDVVRAIEEPMRLAL